MGKSVAIRKFLLFLLVKILLSFKKLGGLNYLFTKYFKKRHLKKNDIMVEFISLALEQ